MNEISLGGVRMRPTESSSAGVVSGETELVFEQTGEIFSARYRGGQIIDGYLIGRLHPDGRVDFRYIQVDRSGKLDAGVSTGSISRLPDGRLRMSEDFRWLTRPGFGHNVFEEEAL